MRPHKIFVIDENPEVVQEIGFRLDELGFDYEGFTTISDVVSALDEDVPDLVILEYRFSELYGAEIIDLMMEWVGDEEKLPPFIVIQSYDDMSLREYASEIGHEASAQRPYSELKHEESFLTLEDLFNGDEITLH